MKPVVLGRVPEGGPSADPSSGALAPGQPLGVYVHFPFCGVRCPYCDFAVDTRADIPHDAYADAVISELAARRAWFEGAGSLASIYFGGGTPGLWRPDALGRVLDAVRAAFGAASAEALEITVEANPGEVDEARLRALRRAGVSRLSLGAQAFDDRLLRALGRNHDAAAIPAAVRATRAAGFEALSLDLMFGLPGQSRDDWRRALDAAVALAPEHVSAYALTVERGTAFGARDRAGTLARPDDELVATMFEDAGAVLAAAGLARYEVSSYARPGHRGRHNGLYWSGAPYLGLGASAASFRPLADGAGWRFSNPRATDTYLAASPLRPRHVERRAAAELENEAVWLGLRTTGGVDRVVHRARYGRDPLDGRAAVRGCLEAGWLVVDEASVRLTPAGFLVADEVATRLWLDPPEAAAAKATAASAASD
ncbi:MAG TPA: radical SAM family heme chaperone HemW [Polyangia bacterium]|nr:radical SAM family heme chaperone HemW [Polyangia bacterium]